jgi:hypothetical protein
MGDFSWDTHLAVAKPQRKSLGRYTWESVLDMVEQAVSRLEAEIFESLRHGMEPRQLRTWCPHILRIQRWVAGENVPHGRLNASTRA